MSHAFVPEEYNFTSIFRNRISVGDFFSLVDAEVKRDWSYLEPRKINPGSNEIIASSLIDLNPVGQSRDNKRLNPIKEVFSVVDELVSECVRDYGMRYDHPNVEKSLYSIMLFEKNAEWSPASGPVSGDPRFPFSILAPLSSSAKVSFPLLEREFVLDIGDVLVGPTGFPFEQLFSFESPHCFVLQGFFG